MNHMILETKSGVRFI